MGEKMTEGGGKEVRSPMGVQHCREATTGSCDDTKIRSEGHLTRATFAHEELKEITARG